MIPSLAALVDTKRQMFSCGRRECMKTMKENLEKGGMAREIWVPEVGGHGVRVTGPKHPMAEYWRRRAEEEKGGGEDPMGDNWENYCC